MSLPQRKQGPTHTPHGKATLTYGRNIPHAYWNGYQDAITTTPQPIEQYAIHNHK